MKLETVQERIKNIEERISKKEATIDKKEKLIIKKQAQVEKLGFADMEEARKAENFEAVWMFYDIDSLMGDVMRLYKEVKELKAKFEQYKEDLVNAEKEELSYLNEVPETLKALEKELSDRWTKEDLAIKERVLKDRKSMEYRDWFKKYNQAARLTASMTEEEIKKDCKECAKNLVVGLFKRVRYITGEVKSWNDVILTWGSYGFPTLNGTIYGKEGTCRVESIIAGGPIQRTHVRVLTKEVN